MSSRVIFKGKSSTHIMNVSKNDRDIATPDNFGDDLEFIWILNQYPDETISYDHDSILSAMESFHNVIGNDLSLLEYDYKYEHVIPGFEHFGPTRGRGTGGVEIEGQKYTLDSGSGYCYMLLMEFQPDGTAKPSKRIDCRNRNVIETDNLGNIKILRKKKNLTWLNILPPLIDFIKQLEDKQIEVKVVWDKPKFMDYIIAYQEGEGADDWAMEELGKMGNKAKEKLLEKLKDAKASKYYYAIASLLMFVFPS